MFTAQAAYHHQPHNVNDDDDLPQEESAATHHPPQITTAPNPIATKPKIHMANTAYEGGFGVNAGPSTQISSSGLNTQSQMKGYYQQPQMAASHYVVKPQGTTLASQQHMMM